MELFLVILSALAPVAVAMLYIYRKDSAQPEPASWLAKSFWYGILSAFLASSAVSLIIIGSLGYSINTEGYTSVVEAFTDAFVMAAIPEELAKFYCLYAVLKKNPYFDEKFDGIVYSVCIGMGFAGLENVLYLIGGIESGTWVRIGITRALFSIPGHFFFAVLMGYYYSLYHWGVNRSFKTKIMILLAPILAHGIFDGILFSTKINEVYAAIGVILFLGFFLLLRKKGQERIERLMNQ